MSQINSTTDEALKQAATISESISKKLDPYTVFRAQVAIDGILFLSEPLLRTDVVRLLKNMPVGLRRIDGFRQGTGSDLGDWVEGI